MSLLQLIFLLLGVLAFIVAIIIIGIKVDNNRQQVEKENINKTIALKMLHENSGVKLQEYVDLFIKDNKYSSTYKGWR